MYHTYTYLFVFPIEAFINYGNTLISHHQLVPLVACPDVHG